MRGPPPRPVERDRMLGNPGHKTLPAVPTAINDRVAIPPAKGIPRPARKLATAQGRRFWRRLWHYAGAWLSEGTDLEILTRYVENLELRAHLRDELGAGYIVAGSMGQDVLNPLLRQLNQTERLLLQLEAHLGFTPADRSRIGKAEIVARGKLEDLSDRREKRALEREKQRLQVEAERARIANQGNEGVSNV